MDITRIGVQDEPKMIRTSEDLVEEEINRLTKKVEEKGYTLIPLNFYLKK